MKYYVVYREGSYVERIGPIDTRSDAQDAISHMIKSDEAHPEFYQRRREYFAIETATD